MHYVQVLYSEHRPPVVTFAYNTFDYFVNYLLGWQSPERKHVIAVGTHIDKQHEPCILYNTEQMTCARHREHIVQRLQQGDVVEVWDYSAYNVDVLSGLLRKHGDAGLASITVRHVPLRVVGPQLRRLKAFNALVPGKEYDVGFCGTPSVRRDQMLHFLQTQGISVHRVNAFGEQRDRELCKCRIILNIHHNDEYKVFESLRCEPWLALEIPVISEECVDNDRRCTITEYYDLPRVIMNTLHALKTGT